MVHGNGASGSHRIGCPAPSTRASSTATTACSRLPRRALGNVVQGNAAGGSDRIGFQMLGEACGDDHWVANNSAHGNLVGLLLQVRCCIDCQRVTLTRRWHT